eukprot:CAMPEP_0119259632 /NCGR_PEP_ID=MMETSP1329-20130426/373_1 /TAXON_ID=114041 /ORGANISM="Genus nov. species nov., Strain RCC1024" /LENGTH=70 /DNA_ID=CAMNT_0007259025 /DNA_START=180 /DNA_END=388 /DNA_ORIENTATION=-
MAELTERILRQGIRNIMRATTPEEVLDVAPGASRAAVMKAYRELSTSMHPDKAVPAGVPVADATEAQKRR